MGKSSDDESSIDKDVVSSSASLVTRTDEMMEKMERKERERSQCPKIVRDHEVAYGWIKFGM